MPDAIICEKCGAEMVDRSSEHTIAIVCPNCGWGWATTAYDPLWDDDTEYEIWLKPGNLRTIETIRLIAGIANVNFLRARTMLGSNSEILLYKAYTESAAEYSKVQRIQKIARKLADTDIEFSIVPDFSYEF